MESKIQNPESEIEDWLDVNRRVIERVPRLGGILAAMALLGGLAFVYALFSNSFRAWQAYWVNFLFWAGLAQAGVVLAAIVHLVQGRWGGTVVRLGLLQVAFVPLTVILYAGIASGASIQVEPALVPWLSAEAADVVAGKQWWLNLPFFLLRDFLALLALCIASLAFAYHTLRPEVGALRERGLASYPEWLARGWRGMEEERAHSRRVLSWLAPLLIFLYAIVYTLIGFDMVMSLDPAWYSTLFGAYYFMTTLFTGVAAVAVIAAIARKRLGLEDHFTSSQFHDLGKMMLAFCLLSTDFFWSQYLVIWYGDLPEEVAFVVHRIEHQPWRTLSFIVLFGGFIIPFIVLLNRRIKQIPETLAALALVVLVTGFAERLLMILPSLPAVPSSRSEAGILFPKGIIEFLVSIGFMGLYGLSLLWALRNAPLVPARPAASD